jgi:hypothetical protein
MSEDLFWVERASPRSPARNRLAYVFMGASGPVVIEGCLAPDRSGKPSVRNATAATISVHSECIDFTCERKRTNAYQRHLSYYRTQHKRLAA